MISKESSQIVVVGLGPVGGILACHLSSSGVTTYGVDIWDKHRQAINQNGISIEGYKHLQSHLHGVYPSIEKAPVEDADYVVICVKTPYMKPIIEYLAQAKGAFSIVSFQNGLDNEEYLAEFVERDRILRVVVNYAGNLIAPGKIKMTFFNKPNYIGCLCPEGPCEKAKKFAELVTKAHLDTQVAKDIKRYTWEKTILNAVLSPISAVLSMTMQEVMNLGDTFFLVEKLLEEATIVAKGVGYDFGEGFIGFALDYLSKGGNHKPSMLVDLEMNKPTEIDFINGKIVYYGHRLNIPVPYHESFTALVKALEKKKRREYGV